jgi:hypothetical protein
MRKLGFVIANEREEYLVQEHEYFDRFDNGWSKLVDLAMIYRTRSRLNSVLKRLHTVHKLYVLELFDTGKRFMVRTVDDEVPSWIRCT